MTLDASEKVGNFVITDIMVGVKGKVNMQESVDRITSVVDKMIARCDEIADCAPHDGARICNLFAPRDARKSVELMLDFIAAIASASSMAAVVATAPALEALADHAKSANDAIASALPRNCRSLITCFAAGEQFILNLLLRGDSTALALAKIAHHLTLPLKQILLLCSQKLHEQLTVGC